MIHMVNLMKESNSMENPLTLAYKSEVDANKDKYNYFYE